MEKKEIVSKFWAKAEKIVKTRLILIHICLAVLGIAIMHSVFVCVFHSTPWSWVLTSWPVYAIYFAVILSASFLPLGEISEGRIRTVFYELSVKAAQDHAAKVTLIYKTVKKISLELEELESLNNIYSEILKENSEEMNSQINIIENKRK